MTDNDLYDAAGKELAAALRAMDQVYREVHVPVLGEGEFTIGLYAKRAGLPTSIADREVKLAVERGLIVEVGRRKVASGRLAMAYRLRADAKQD